MDVFDGEAPDIRRDERFAALADIPAEAFSITCILRVGDIAAEHGQAVWLKNVETFCGYAAEKEEVHRMVMDKVLSRYVVFCFSAGLLLAPATVVAGDDGTEDTFLERQRRAVAAVLLFTGFGLGGLIISGRISSEAPFPQPTDPPVFSLAWTPPSDSVNKMIEQYSLEQEIKNMTADLSVVAKVVTEYADSLLLFGRDTDNNNDQ